MKDKEYQISTLDVRGKKLAATLDKKSTIINDMLLSRANTVAAGGDIGKLDD